MTNVKAHEITNTEMRDGKGAFDIGPLSDDVELDAKHALLPSTARSKFVVTNDIPASSSGWKVLLAVRSVIATENCRTRCVSCVTGSPVVHVELVIRRRCTGPKTCTYAMDSSTRYNGLRSDKWKHATASTTEPLEHFVSYSIRDAAAVYDKDGTQLAPPDNYVACAIDFPYSKHCGWHFVSLPLSDRQVDKLEAFFRSQLGCYYSSETLCCVNATCCWCCIHCGNCSPCGVNPSQLYGKGGNVPRQRYFCSEFIACALIASGYVHADQLHPSITTPASLVEFVSHQHGHHTLQRAECIATEVLMQEEREDNEQTKTKTKQTAKSDTLTPSECWGWWCCM